MPRSETITVARLKASAVLKIHFIGLAGFLVPLSLVQGVLATFGFNSLVWNGSYLHGAGALLAGPLMGLALATLLTLAMTPFSFLGLWLYSRLRPLQLKVIASSDTTPAATP